MQNKGTLGIGVGVMIINDRNEILLGHRVHEEHDTWSFPGGKLDFGETLLEASIRETKEECNLDIKNLEQISVSEGFHKEKNTQFVTVGYMTRGFSGTLINREPDTFSEWRWFPLDKIPENIFGPSEALLKQAKRFLN